MIYFDNAATTSVNPEVARVYSRLVSDMYGNPDSLHTLGRQCGTTLSQARTRIASMLGVLPESILFTSGGSESNSLATVGYALKNQAKGKHIITSDGEHSSTTNAMNYLESLGFEVTRLPMEEKGYVSADQVKNALRKDTILVSLLHVNNETGAITPLSEIADEVHAYPYAKLHGDLVQSFAKEKIPFDKLDMASVSAHKIHGLKGSGFLMKKPSVHLQPLIFGGQQEQGLRGGTENAPADIVLAKTVRLALDSQYVNRRKVQQINEYIRQQVQDMEGGHIHSPENASPYILSLSFDSITSEVLMNALDDKGICVSAKSTCESHSGNESEILKRMGKPSRVTTHAIRLAFSGDNTMDEARQFITTVKEVLSQYGLPL